MDSDDTEKKTSNSNLQNLIIPVFSLLVGLIGVIIGAYFQHANIMMTENLKAQEIKSSTELKRQDICLKQYELTFLEKQKAFAAFMSQLLDTWMLCYNTESRLNDLMDNPQRKKIIIDNLKKATYHYILLAPFIPVEKLPQLDETFNEISSNIFSAAGSEHGISFISSDASKQGDLIDNLRQNLLITLFPKEEKCLIK